MEKEITTKKNLFYTLSCFLNLFSVSFFLFFLIVLYFFFFISFFCLKILFFLIIVYNFLNKMSSKFYRKFSIKKKSSKKEIFHNFVVIKQLKSFCNNTFWRNLGKFYWRKFAECASLCVTTVIFFSYRKKKKKRKKTLKEKMCFCWKTKKFKNKECAFVSKSLCLKKPLLKNSFLFKKAFVEKFFFV